MATIPDIADDPCGRARALRGVRDQLVTGGSVVEAEQQAGNGGRRRIQYSEADLSALERQIAEAENACSLAGGGKPKRFAIGGRL